MGGDITLSRIRISLSSPSPSSVVLSSVGLSVVGFYVGSVGPSVLGSVGLSVDPSPSVRGSVSSSVFYKLKYGRIIRIINNIYSYFIT